ncbi:phage tail protein I [Acinetobacter ursingii]|uniref:phage tail protein I n=1 Tax=Acinetobacter ursingii TaxID=108980 RepID=UPI003009E489
MSNLLPPNSTQFERQFISAFARVSYVETPTRSFNLPLEAPKVILPWLAWEKSVDDWKKDWSEDQKRQTIASSYYVHCHKGTVSALERALNSVGYQTQVQEWFNMQPQGQPYTFKIHISVGQIGVSAKEMQDLMQIVNNNKNLRSHLIGTTVTVKSSSEVKAAATCTSGHETDFDLAAGGLYLNGTWALDGSKKLNGVNL